MSRLKPLSRQALYSAGRLIDWAMLAAGPFRLRPNSLIFMFHSVGRKDGSKDGASADHSYEVFAGFLKWLTNNAQVVPLAHLVPDESAGLQISNGKVLAALSFDDAHLDNYSTVYPLLASLHLPATFFVPSGLIGLPHAMTRSMVQEVAKGGITIGSHSVTHRRLTSLSLQEVESELRGSKAALEDLTGLECRELAYPYGLYDKKTMAIAESAGYLCAAGASLYEPPGARFALPRTTIRNVKSPWSYRMALQDVNCWRRQLHNLQWVDGLIRNNISERVQSSEAV